MSIDKKRIFSDLLILRAPNSTTLVGTQEDITHLPVWKPNRTDFFRVHADSEMCFGSPGAEAWAWPTEECHSQQLGSQTAAQGMSKR
jgi:hypothetical protein